MSRHPLEVELNASAREIMDAIAKGFRAKVDVKGKLAELFLFKDLTKLQNDGVLDNVEWVDADGEPDFIIGRRGRTLKVECKNIRSGENYKRPPAYKAELQKTRNSKDGTPTRGYSVTEFDVLAICMFNQTGKWDFRFILTRDLETRPENPEILKVMHRVPTDTEPPWHDDLHSLLGP